MPLAEARTLVTGANFRPYDPDADHAALRELCWRCHRYSPLVGIEDSGFPAQSKIQNPLSSRARDGASTAKIIHAADSLFLDTTGCTHLFGGESSWVERIHTDLTARGFTVRVALADTPGAAWAVAHYQSLLETTVIPFIIRGVNLLGIDSVMAPMAERRDAWGRIVRDLPMELLDRMTTTVGLKDLPELGSRILKGEIQGRVVVEI